MWLLNETITPREEATLPTIALEALFESLIIGAHEGSAVHTFDFPGAFLHASLHDDKIVNMKFESEFVEIMCEVNP